MHDLEAQAPVVTKDHARAIAMTARSFAIAFTCIVAVLLAGTMAVNVIIDPEAVFDPSKANGRVTSNTRYVRFVNYRDAKVRHEGVLFASSRGNTFERDRLARHMGVGSVANFAVNYGMITDHLPVLEYLLRERAAHGERLEAVLLMIDVDHFGKSSWTNSNLDGFLPPEVSGEHPARFWWRNLTAFRIRLWLAAIRREPERRVERPGPALGQPIQAALVPPLRLPWASPYRKIAGTERRYDIVARPELGAHLALLARFAAICRDNGVRLAVVTSPLNRRNAGDYDPRELARVVAALSRVVPVWDFGAPDWLSDRPDLWLDLSHFRPEVARMMLDRVYGPAPSAPAPFGTLRHDP
jgi:hypothetical protein